MNKEDIIRMAREAGLWETRHSVEMAIGGVGELERFAALVASAERERIKQANAPEIERINAYIKEALAQPEQEPVAWMQVTRYGNKLLAFTEPPLEPPCYTGEFIAAKNYPLFLK